MIPVDAAISRFRRDLTIGAMLRGLLLAAAVGCILAGPMTGSRFNGSILLMAVGGLWLVLGYRSVKGSRLAADSPSLIASGQYDEAETRIDAALRSFSIFKAAKLVSLHHLAVLRHAQRRWQESAQLCRALLGQRLGSVHGLSRPSMLLLADDLLHLGDLAGAYEALRRLYEHKLSLTEALTLQHLQLDYLARIGAWGEMLANVGAKAQLAELMPAGSAARCQAFLALAAAKVGRPPLADWLRRRAEALADTRKLADERPVLAELWPHEKDETHL